MTNYARELAGDPSWSWQPGMRGQHMGIVVDVVGDAVYAVNPNEDCGPARWTGKLCPDLNDPATKGWLLRMLREAWGEDVHPDLCARYDCGREGVDAHWYAASGPPCATEGEALAAALLAVWGMRPAKVEDLGTDADRKPRTF